MNSDDEIFFSCKESPNSIEKNKYFIGKALCILSRYPFFEEFKKILLDIKKRASQGLNVPIEDILTYLVYSIPAPTRSTI